MLTREEWRTLWLTILAMSLFIVIGFASQSWGAEHHHPAKDMQLHEQFYKTWNMPTERDADGKRYQSCCNDKDCYPTAIRKVNEDTYEAHRRPEDKTETNSEWVRFPASLLEQNQSDEKESPDGQTHACISPYTDTVFCATLGSGI